MALSEEDLKEQLQEASRTRPVEDTLSTDQRVLARVTDGIYRRPASALRELISNAYDADATRVTIRTERPEFNRVSIDDNGNGMSADTLIRLLKHIGGSTKRTAMGEEFNVTQKGNPNLSPNGRPLIGKIGIGLFSVAQLTQAFQIVTKVAGDHHQTVASIILRQYAEQAAGENDDEEYEAGKFRLWRERAEDEAAHGTSIILNAIRPQTRESLQSVQKWQSLLAQADEGSNAVAPPKFHVGRLDPENPELLQRFGDLDVVRLPWQIGDEGTRAMERLFGAVWQAYEQGVQNPSVEKIFDEYLAMIWMLSLAPPLKYIDGHPFDLIAAENLRPYKLEAGGEVERLQFNGIAPLRSLARLGDAVRERDDFEVQIDEISLSRPISFKRFAGSSATLQDSLLFVAAHRESFPGVDKRMSGGDLEFQAYILISPKVIPVEHRGVKIRVNEASGIPFDPSFMDFPVAETQRLPRITCEIFVVEGLDGALNIDRESFNYAHAHIRALTKWLHSALRRVIAEEKRLAAQVRREYRAAEKDRSVDEVRDIIDVIRHRRYGPEAEEPPEVKFMEDSDAASGDGAGYWYPSSIVESSGPGYREREARSRTLVTAITQLLDAYGLLDDTSPEDRTTLLKAIKDILEKLS
ncbi:ATP-binding protein [Jidongwangia harbinensis]|uniref:ATP-binding protein n=1 Tax=Jidongwangia harbinensis TaxID=2878561 RepID=UPI001CD9FB89|nr:ATP-binding protein [Jidongwangia harbinensis]MCA2219483.1 ATP-binding protein [Jidongwangia harbinensis]